MAEQERVRTMLRAVELYYRDGLTQAAIADRLGCTRWTVGRLLKDAADVGMVTVSVHHPFARRVDLEEQLSDKFQLRRCRVLPTQPTPQETLSMIARHVGDYLSDLRPHPNGLALGWGPIVAAVAHAIRPQWSRGVTVAQADVILESPDFDVITSAAVLMAKKGRGVAKLFYTPSASRTLTEAEKLRTLGQIPFALAAASTADVLLFSPIPEIQTRSGSFKPTREAAAYALGHWFDSDGGTIRLDQERALPVLDLEKAKQIKHKLVASYGEDRRQALRAIIAAGLVDELVTDSETALHLADA